MVRKVKIGPAKKKQTTKQTKKDATAQISRVRNSSRCSINGALVASRAASSSGVGLTTRRVPARGKWVLAVEDATCGAQWIQAGGTCHIVQIPGHACALCGFPAMFIRSGKS